MPEKPDRLLDRWLDYAGLCGRALSESWRRLQTALTRAQARTLLGRFPRTHVHIAGAGAVALALTAGLWTGDHPNDAETGTVAASISPPALVPNVPAPLSALAPRPTEPFRSTSKRSTRPPLARLERHDLAAGREPSRDTSMGPEPETPESPMAAAAPSWETVEVSAGDSLARIFQKESLAASALIKIIHSGDAAEKLRHIRSGQQLSYRTNDAGRLLALRYQFGPLEYVEVQRASPEATFESKRVVHEPKRRRRFVEAEIDNALFLASQRMGLPNQLTMQLAHIFQWDIDFILDIRSGDSFRVLYEEHYYHGEKIGHGPILAAEFVTRGERYRAVRYEDTHGEVSYYAPDGRSMRKAFLRAPVKFTRVSSKFNMQRRHPIRKTIMPHRGIDYAAPTGTPVLAAGDGRVTRITHDHYASGNYLVIRHTDRYQTKYLHLTRFADAVDVGTRVEQGDVIGYVGATGWATGPHLHYEFLVAGTHRNPRTVPLPKAEPVPESERSRFEAAARPLIAALETHQRSERIALSGGGE